MEIFNTHGYKPEQEILVDAEFILGVLSFCQRVDASQPKLAVPMMYAKQTREITDKETKELQRVDFDWAEYPTAMSFANTAFSENGSVPIMTELSLFSFQIQQALLNYHQKNIDNGIATEVKDGK